MALLVVSGAAAPVVACGAVRVDNQRAVPAVRVEHVALQEQETATAAHFCVSRLILQDQ
jgi:hypothetical protein